MASGDDDGGDDTASTLKPLTANQKRVIQNIHNNCGHQEFLRALRLSRARSEVLNYLRPEFECQRVQPKDILRSQGCLQHYHGHSVLMRRLVWIFLYPITRWHQNHLLQHGMLEHAVSIVYPHFGQDSSHSVKVHNRAVDSILWFSVGDHCGRNLWALISKEFTNANTILFTSLTWEHRGKWTDRAPLWHLVWQWSAMLPRIDCPNRSG